MLSVNAMLSADASESEPWWVGEYPDREAGARYQLQLLDTWGMPLWHLCGLTRKQLEQLGATVAAALAGDTTPAVEADACHAK